MRAHRRIGLKSRDTQNLVRLLDVMRDFIQPGGLVTPQGTREPGFRIGDLRSIPEGLQWGSAQIMQLAQGRMVHPSWEAIQSDFDSRGFASGPRPDDAASSDRDPSEPQTQHRFQSAPCRRTLKARVRKL